MTSNRRTRRGGSSEDHQRGPAQEEVVLEAVAVHTRPTIPREGATSNQLRRCPSHLPHKRTWATVAHEALIAILTAQVYHGRVINGLAGSCCVGQYVSKGWVDQRQSPGRLVQLSGFEVCCQPAHQNFRQLPADERRR